MNRRSGEKQNEVHLHVTHTMEIEIIVAFHYCNTYMKSHLGDSRAYGADVALLKFFLVYILIFFLKLVYILINSDSFAHA